MPIETRPLLEPSKLPPQVDTCVFGSERFALCGTKALFEALEPGNIGLPQGGGAYSMTPMQANGFAMSAGLGQLKCHANVDHSGPLADSFSCMPMGVMLKSQFGSQGDPTPAQG